MLQPSKHYGKINKNFNLILFSSVLKLYSGLFLIIYLFNFLINNHSLIQLQFNLINEGTENINLIKNR